MKKRIYAIILVLAMILTLLPTGNYSAADTPGLRLRWANWTQNGPVEDTTMFFNSELNDSPGFTRDVFFYFEDSTGATRVQASELTSGNTNIVKLSQNTQNGDATSVEIVGFGQTTIDYVKDGVTYSLNVNIDIPFSGFYSSATASQSTYIREFEVSDTSNTYYFITTDGWVIDQLTLQNELAAIANVTIDQTKTIATITVTGTPDTQHGGWYGIDYTLSNATYGQTDFRSSNSIKLINGNPYLAVTWPQWNNGVSVKPQNPYWQTSLTQQTGINGYYISYMKNGVETPLKASDVYSSDTDVIQIKTDDQNPDIILVHGMGLGNANICYTDSVSGITYELPVTIELPMLGYYSSTTPSSATFISEGFTVTDTNDTFYFIARDGWKFDTIYLENDFEAIADLTLNADKTIATIKITGNPINNSWYRVQYVATNPNYGNRMDGGLGVQLFNGKSRIEFACPDGMGLINYFDSIFSAPGTTMDMWIVFNDGQGGEPSVVPLEDLKSSNEDVFTIASAGDTNNPDMFTLKTIGWGKGQLVYTDGNGKQYTLDVVSEIKHQNLGFYKANKISEDNWIPYEYTVKNNTKTFYFKAQNDWTFDNFVLDGDAKNFATVVVSADKKTVTITIKDTLNDYAQFGEEAWFGFNFDSKDEWGHNFTSYYGISLINNLCSHPATHVEGAKAAKCKVAGYTGDTVCNQCKDVVVKGKTIAATGHKYKNDVCTVCKAKRVSIKNAKVTLSTSKYTYNGKAKTPTVTVKVGSKTLKKNTDYTVKYSKNTNIGTATVTITGKGDYKGSISKTFTISAKTGATFTYGAYKYKVTSSSAVAFTGVKSTKTTKVTVPKTVKYGGKTFKVTAIADNALKNTKVTNVTIGSYVTKIGKSAFEGCTKLSKVTIGSAVTTIGDKAFKKCTALKSITVPSKVKTIGKEAFYGCKNLKTITVKSTKLTLVGKNAFKGINTKATIKVPSSKLKAYQKTMKNKGQGSKVKITK